MIKKVTGFIGRNRLLCKNKKYIVALSGGADSTALLIIMLRLGYNVEAAHCNFHLRGEESLRDENFCVDLCNKNHVKLHKAHFDTRTYAEVHKVSIEMAARDLRYAYFRQLKNDIGADAICVAHHCDDSVETFLMNLIRGTGIQGLTGISPINDDIVRPLLCVSRKEIEKYLNDIGQNYVTDSTNLINDVTRNKIRLDVIPLLESINPSVSNNIARTAERINEAMRVFNCSIHKSVNNVVVRKKDAVHIIIDKLKEQPSPEYTLYYILKNFSFTPDGIEHIYGNIDAAPGTEYRSKTHQLLIDRDTIIIEPADEEKEEKNMCIPETGIYVYNNQKFKFERFHRTKGFKINHSNNCCCLDAKNLNFPFFIRKTDKGDRFIPLGMKGSKLLSDYMTDRKMTLFDKRRQSVVTDSKGRIIWVVNERPDDRFRITDETTDIFQITMTIS